MERQLGAVRLAVAAYTALILGVAFALIRPEPAGRPALGDATMARRWATI